MNMPKIKDEVDLIRSAKRKGGASDAAIAGFMTAFGWTISEALVTAWLNGTKRPTDVQRQYIRLWLIDFYDLYATI